MGWLFGRTEMRKSPSLQGHLADLSRAFHLWVGDSDDFVIVDGVRLPTGFNCAAMQLLIELPSDYPLGPPGVGGSKVYVPPSLRYHKHELRDVHLTSSPKFATPGFGPWAWWCYEWIQWDPFRDNLIKFVEMIRADLTNPPTK